MPSDPVVLFSPDGRRSKRFAAIDAPGWMKAGWSLTPIERVVIEKVAIAISSENSLDPADPQLEISTQPNIPATPPPQKSEGKKK